VTPPSGLRICGNASRLGAGPKKLIFHLGKDYDFPGNAGIKKDQVDQTVIVELLATWFEFNTTGTTTFVRAPSTSSPSSLASPKLKSVSQCFALYSAKAAIIR